MEARPHSLQMSTGRPVLAASRPNGNDATEPVNRIRAEDRPGREERERRGELAEGMGMEGTCSKCRPSGLVCNYSYIVLLL